MKNRIIIASILLLLVVEFIIIIKNNKKVYVDIDGIKYAILVDGVSSNTFPNGNYKVDIDCTNADAYWNSITNKLIVKNIKGNITCDIEFTSITNNDYLNTYLTSLSGTTQGAGQIIHEIGSVPDYTSTSVITSYGTTPEYFHNTSNTSTTQTNTNSYWAFNNGTFTSDPSNFTISGNGNYYHVYAQVPEAGYYQICYTIDQALNTNNALYVSKNTTALISFGASVTAPKGEACYDLGYFQATDYINIAERGYSGTSSPEMSFRLEKSNNEPTSIDTGFRYEGTNPNNYVMFNNEIWRIIGVFSTEYDSNNDGNANVTTNLVKIIKEESIGGPAWDKSNTNNWPNSSLYHLLNELYYDWETNKSNVNTYCYGATSIPATCDYDFNGIQGEYRNMLAKAKWYLGGGGKSGYTKYTPESVYSYERDSNAIYNGRATSTLGYIGLMYESDYLYGVLASNCARTTAHGSYSKSSCAGKNWLYGQGYEWIISHNSGSSTSVWYLSNTGAITNNNASFGYGVRPVLYLSSSVYKVSGTGTITDPYIIGMAS